MLFLNQDIELSLDLRRQHEYLGACNYEDPYFTFNEGSSLMQVVSASGNIQTQQYVPFSDDACKVALNMQPGPIPGFDANRLDLNHHLASYQSPGSTAQVPADVAERKRSSGAQSGSQKSSEGSPMPSSKRAKSASIVHTSYRQF